MMPDFLSQFESEDRVPPSASLISLQDIVGRATTVHWDEAVAVVEEVCELAIAAGGDTALVPQLEDVLLDGDGHITLPSSRGDNSPTAAGRMLHTLLSNGDVPMALRLFVTQSTSRDTHASLPEFARALGYFGKPDRRRLIQDIYSRFLQQLRTAPETAQVPPPMPLGDPAEEKKGQKHAKRKPIGKWLLAAGTVAIAGSAAWLLNNGEASGDMQGSAARMLSGAADALADLGQQVSKVLGSEDAAPAAVPPDSSSEVIPSKPKPRSAASGVGVEPIPIRSRRVSVPKSAEALSLAAAMPPRVDFEAAPVYEPPVEQPVTAPDVVYSSADLEVTPPALVFPQLTPPLVRSGASVAAVNRMVVVVSAEGTVERVQLIEGPARMVDMMLLSGAKTWKFTPASRNGEPVRYRTVISWMVQQ